MPDFTALGWIGIILIVVGLVIVILKAFTGRPSIQESTNPIVIIINWLIKTIEKGMKDASYLGWALMAFGALLLVLDGFILNQGNGNEPASTPSPPPSEAP